MPNPPQTLEQQIVPREPLPYKAVSLKSAISNTETIVDIRALVGAGESCLAYSGFINGNPVTVKEYYPTEFANQNPSALTREGSKLKISEEYKSQFQGSNYLGRFKASFDNWVEYQKAAPQFTLWPELLDSGDSVYLVTKMGGNASLKDSRDSLLAHPTDTALKQCVEIAISLLNRLKPIHDLGRLYIDIKPENILLFQDALTPGESRSVALFDFDSTIDINAARQHSDSNCSIYPSEFWAAPEIKKHSFDFEAIGKHTDIYSVGLVLLWLLLGEEIDDLQTPLREHTIQNSISRRFYDKSDNNWVMPDRVLNQLSKTLRNALFEDRKRRYQDTECMRIDLIEVLSLLGANWVERTPKPEVLKTLEDNASVIYLQMNNLSKCMQQGFAEIQNRLKRMDGKIDKLHSTGLISRKTTTCVVETFEPIEKVPSEAKESSTSQTSTNRPVESKDSCKAKSQQPIMDADFNNSVLSESILSQVRNRVVQLGIELDVSSVLQDFPEVQINDSFHEYILDEIIMLIEEGVSEDILISWAAANTTAH